MLYGFEDAGQIILLAGDDVAEFEDCSNILSSVILSRVSSDDVVSMPRFSGCQIQPYIIESGEVSPDQLTILSRNEAMVKHNAMVAGEDKDDVDQLYEMYVKRRGHVEQSSVSLSAEDILLPPKCNPHDIFFVATHDKVNGTLVSVLPRDFWLEKEKPIYDVFMNDYRIGELLSLPIILQDGEEVAPGCFHLDLSPLAARVHCLAHGWVEDDDLVKYAMSRFPAVVDASSFEETAFALDLVTPVKGDDFIFALRPNDTRASTNVLMVPRTIWQRDHALPKSIFLTPIVSEILGEGFGELTPCHFEVLGSEEQTRLRLLNASMEESMSLRNSLGKPSTSKQGLSSVSPVTKNKPTWDDISQAWPRLGDHERLEMLPNSDILFCAVEEGTTIRLTLTPKAFFDEMNSILEEDFNLETRLMADCDKIGPNIFRVTGYYLPDLLALMTQNNFQESFRLLICVNLASDFI